MTTKATASASMIIFREVNDALDSDRWADALRAADSLSVWIERDDFATTGTDTLRHLARRHIRMLRPKGTRSDRMARPATDPDTAYRDLNDALDGHRRADALRAADSLLAWLDRDDFATTGTDTLRFIARLDVHMLRHGASFSLALASH